MITPEKRKKMEDLIYRFFSAMDDSGVNTRHYKDLFSSMTDKQFDNYFKLLFKNDSAFLRLDVVDYERPLTMDEIEKASKVLNIPLFEKVAMPHTNMDKDHPIVTKEPVPVGYIIIKRTQQTVQKKNGISTNIDQRSPITGQAIAADKNGRSSDLENTMLVSMGLDNTLRELNGPRSDDMVMKNKMLHDIALNGYAKISDMESLPENKTSLNTTDVYFLGMGIKSDLVTKGLMLSSTIKKEL